MFDASGELAKRAMIFANQQVRVVAKAVCAAWFVDDEAAAAPLGGEADGPRRVGERQRADIGGSPFFSRDRGQFTHELGVVRFVGRPRAAEAGRVDSRP